MNRRLLQVIYNTLSIRSKNFNYNDFPKTNPSLQMENPSKEQINEDYYNIRKHFTHPVFENFVNLVHSLLLSTTFGSRWKKRYLFVPLDSTRECP